MNDAPKTPVETAKREKLLRSLRLVWIFLIVIFAAVILLRLYNWSQGKDNLTGILSPLGMIFLGLSQIVGERRKPLYYAFLTLALVLVFTGLAMLIVY